MPPISKTFAGSERRDMITDGSQPPAVPEYGRPQWLRAVLHPTLLLCVAGVLLPNALSLGALIYGIGVPPRTAAIVGYAALAIGARIVAWPITVALYLALVAYDSICTIAALFNLAPGEIGTVLDQLADLEVFQSSLYIALTLGAVALVGANLIFLTLKGKAFRHGNAVALAGLALAVAAVDLLANTSPHYQFARFAAYGKPMESAAVKSGFQKGALAGRSPRVLLVVVEALGQFADPEHRALLLGALKNPDLAGRYEVTAGSVPYYGSTTAAEMRELCFSRESYEVVIEGKDLDCLPREMAARGYRTVSLHNFKSDFFDRDDWYPKLGFQKHLFGDEAAGGHHERLCGGPFRGPCDVDVIPTIARELRDAAGPTFAYWMTLSTHVPIALGEGTPRLGCGGDGGPIGHVKVCNMTEMWMDVLEGLGRLAADLPGTEILIVGDHAPPLWSRAGRALFRPGRVPWFHLKPVGAVHAEAAR